MPKENNKIINCKIIDAPDITLKGALSDNGFFYIEIKQGDQIIKLPANQHIELVTGMLQCREDMDLGGEFQQFTPV